MVGTVLQEYMSVALNLVLVSYKMLGGSAYFDCIIPIKMVSVGDD